MAAMAYGSRIRTIHEGGQSQVPRSRHDQANRSSRVAEVREQLGRCVAFDLESNPNNNQIKSFAAIRRDVEQPLLFRKGKLSDGLASLDEFVREASFVLGHNIIFHDLEILRSHNPRLGILKKPPIDTLWLNPLAFPRNPYHSLVKHYKDARLQSAQASDPEHDAELVFEVFRNQIKALQEMGRSNPDLLTALHWLATSNRNSAGFHATFRFLRKADRPTAQQARAAINRVLAGKACMNQCKRAVAGPPRDAWALAYALSWIMVAGENSTMPPWVRHQFPRAGELVNELRNNSCQDPACEWCQSWANPVTLLDKWFGFDAFRPKPPAEDGRSLQQVLVETAMSGSSLLGILPTGTGKSLCYQLPALSLYQRTGALTVVISPLVALMADQVKSLERHQISSCVTVNGLLSLPERHDALDRVRLGDASILLISPEQLRSRSVRSILEQREIGYWVVDEAHCVSRWGHDFRPDYRYIARFIKNYSDGKRPAPLVCLTATAKPSVIDDICAYFEKELEIEIVRHDGGAHRENLSFEVMETDKKGKFDDVVSILQDRLPQEGRSGAIVYCATRKATERVAEVLTEKGFAAGYYHAGLKPEAKIETQQQFTDGDLRVIAATNAFGMGIDKPDIRVVVHADIPGSLENYVQEAGRGGRDGEPASCILLYSTDDVEKQFSLSARSRLDKDEIAAVLKALRRLRERMKNEGDVIATPGEIVREDVDGDFGRDRTTEDTRVKVAVSWLEDAVLLRRDENVVHVFPSSLRIRTFEEAQERIQKAKISDYSRAMLLRLVRSLLNSPPDRGISTDDLCGETRLNLSELRNALSLLEALGIASNDTAITIYVHLRVEDSSNKRLQNIAGLEDDLLDLLQELAPDLARNEASVLNLRIASQRLHDRGHRTVRPDIVEKLIRGIARDGRNDSEGKGSLRVRRIDRERLSIRLQREWDSLVKISELRRKAAAIILDSLTATAPSGSRGKDIQVATTLGALISALRNDTELAARSQTEWSALLDHALLWLHEQGVVTLGAGLTIFRPAITVRLRPGHSQYTAKDFTPLSIHYEGQTLQTHIMAAYAEAGIADMRHARKLMADYFTLDQQPFVEAWLPDSAAQLRRQTTPESWQEIVESLGNRRQADIVADERERTNVLVLAGPGSGKTRVLVHRIAFLIRVRRQNPQSILALVYNRHAATEIRQRLFALIGDDARGVTVSTCHGMAMRLVGACFARQSGDVSNDDFDEILRRAVTLFEADDLAKGEAEALRDTLIEGFRWILVDEYQDIGPLEYKLISAIAGRSLEDEGSRLSLFAVGDDDQNIYSFRGTSVRYIRQFEKDYRARPVFLTENYRSSANIIAAANMLIDPASHRMKTDNEIVINENRQEEPPGGELERLDQAGRGRVQILRVSKDDKMQAAQAIAELQRISALVPEWSWKNAAVIARNWRYLDPVRSYCEAHDIPIQIGSDDHPNIWRLVETQALVDWIRSETDTSVRAADIAEWLNDQPTGPWWTLLREGLDDLALEIGNHAIPKYEAIEWFAEWSRDARERQTGLLLLSAHKAKGLEFDDVVILDGGWDEGFHREDRDEDRRLYYVAMTRARRSLAMISMSDRHPFLDQMEGPAVLRRTPDGSKLDLESCRNIHLTLGPADVDLDYVGRTFDGERRLRATDEVVAGDEVSLETRNGQMLIVDRNGRPIGRVAQKFKPPPNAVLTAGRIHAVTTRFRKDSREEYSDRIRREKWRVVLPELIYKL